MEIIKNTAVSLQYQMLDAQGQLLDETIDEPLVYLHGGYDGIFPLVEEALHGKKTGDQIDITLQPDDAFGEYDAELVHIEPQKDMPADIEIGTALEVENEDTGELSIFTVTDIADGKVVVDGNHPLAGKAIRFKATVQEVRKASAEELAHGHAHGADGHHHH